MLKLLIVPTLAVMLLEAGKGCNRNKATAQTLKGRLEVKGICSNYTIKLLEGNLSDSLMEKNWTDESTRKVHTNVFGLHNPCALPDTLKEGDEFYFTLDTTNKQTCTVCMAYYPTPSKKISIKLVPAPKQ